MPIEERYYVTRNGIETEVTVEEFVRAEWEAGFSGAGHHQIPLRPATSSFSGNRYDRVNREYDEIRGRTEFIPVEMK